MNFDDYVKTYLGKAETIQLGSGVEYQKQVLELSKFWYLYQRLALPSVYNASIPSTYYSLFMMGRSKELARLQMFWEDIRKDSYADLVRSPFLYQKLGYMFVLDEPFFFPQMTDYFYRRFLFSMENYIFQGAKYLPLKNGIKLFTYDIPYEVNELYLDSVKFGNPDITKLNQFEVKLNLDNQQNYFKEDLNLILRGLDYYYDIMKPAHNYVGIYQMYSDDFNIRDTVTDTQKLDGLLMEYDDFRKYHPSLTPFPYKGNITRYYSIDNNCIYLPVSCIINGTTLELATKDDISLKINGTDFTDFELDPINAIITLSISIPILKAEIDCYYSQHVNVELNYDEGFNIPEENYFNDSIPELGKKYTTHKIDGFYVPVTSLTDYEYTLRNDDGSEFDGINSSSYDHARVFKNYADPPCKSNQITSKLGLYPEGQTLAYPTPPISLRFDINNLPAGMPIQYLYDASISNTFNVISQDGHYYNYVKYIIEFLLGTSPLYSITDHLQTTFGEYVYYPFIDWDLNQLEIYQNDKIELDFIVNGDDNQYILYDCSEYDDPHCLSDGNAMSYSYLELSKRIDDTIPKFSDYEEIEQTIPLSDFYAGGEEDWMEYDVAQVEYEGYNPVYESIDNLGNTLSTISNELEYLYNRVDQIPIGIEGYNLHFVIPPSKVYDNGFNYAGRRRFKVEESFEMNKSLSDRYLYIENRDISQGQGFYNNPFSMNNPCFDKLIAEVIPKPLTDTIPQLTDALSYTSENNYYESMRDLEEDAMLEANYYFSQAISNRVRIVSNDPMFMYNDNNLLRFIGQEVVTI